MSSKSQTLLTKSAAVSMIFKTMLVLSILWIPRSIVSAETNNSANYYVSPTGSDNNPGTLAQPWKTLTFAADQIHAGDTLYIRGGTYHEQLWISNSGTSYNPIVLTNYNGEEVIIDGVNNTLPIHGSGTPLIAVAGDWVNVRNITIQFSGETGVVTLGKHVTLDNLNVHHNWEGGVILTGDYDLIQNSQIWYNSTVNENGQSLNGWDTGVSCARHPNHCTIRKTIAWENWGEGISTYESNGTVIEDNIIYDNWAANVYISDATNTLCQRNFVYNTGTMMSGDQVGIQMGDEVYNPPSANITVINNISFGNHGNFWWWQGLQGGGMNNVLIANNTFVNGIGDPNHGEGGIIISQGDHQNVRFENNLVQQDGDLPVIATFDQPGVTYSHNLWSKTPPSAASGPGDVIGDPLLAKIGDIYSPEWYKLTDLSPAINNAIFEPVIYLDYFMNHRGNFPDIGFDENNPIIITQLIFLPSILNTIH